MTKLNSPNIPLWQKGSSATLGKYITLIAENVCQAQRQISKKYIPNRFQPSATIYQIPRVDFDLKLWFYANDNTDNGNISNLYVRPVDAYSPTPQGASVIKGSLVTVSAKGVTCELIFNTSLESTDNGMTITVEVKSLTREYKKGVEVHFMLDPDMSQKLNCESYHFSPNTQLEKATVMTNNQGVAQNKLIVDSEEPPNTYIAVIIEVCGEAETVVYQKP